ncbi:MAG: hypothetical protein IJJ63_00115 [Bacilli bacterium]|nr:hypothetical protein [Bacilli bacterium]
MLVIPVNKEGRIYSIGCGIKNKEKIGTNVFDESLLESDIVVNSEKFSDSSYRDSVMESAPTDFIRSRSIYYQRDIRVSTRSRSNSQNYDVYRVIQPPRKVNDSLDSLYGKAITDIRKEIPDSSIKGRYISLKKLGIDELFSEERINKMKKITEEENDSSRWPELFEKEGIGDFQDIIDFLDVFEFTMLSNRALPETSLQDAIDSLSIINTRDFRSLRNYRDMAKSNMEVLSRISYVKQVLHSRPLSLVYDKEKAKILVKKREYEDYKQAA